MRIKLNGSPKDLDGSPTVADLVRQLGLERAACAVEVNARLVRKSEHPTHALREGDRVEVVTLVGGG
jgi:thiamine biosynthesis protein ThiS